jgi:hypothetical protein
VVVGLDLILWLWLGITALLTIGAASGLSRFGRDANFLPDPSYGSSYGSSYGYNHRGYYLTPNDTWVYNVTSAYSGRDMLYNTTSGEWYYVSPSPSNIIRDCTPQFATCAEQDTFINTLWRAKPQRLALNLTVATAQIIVLLLHFVLFVWGCVDTHRRNQQKKKDNVNVHLVAQAMIQDMQRRGMVTVHGGGPVVYGPMLYGPAVHNTGPYGPIAYGPPMQPHPEPAPRPPPIRTERWA